MNYRNFWIVAVATIAILSIIVAWQWFFTGGLTDEQREAYNMNLNALAHLEIGMKRAEADPFLVESKAHYQCDYETWVRDVFLFYDSMELSFPLVLHYKKEGGDEVLTGIYSPEPYLIETDVQVCDKIR